MSQATFLTFLYDDYEGLLGSCNPYLAMDKLVELSDLIARIEAMSQIEFNQYRKQNARPVAYTTYEYISIPQPIEEATDEVQLSLF